ncbi:restriction endonuclease subunit S [Novosphingobium sp. YJ-S2-02]|uniref:Restriction endonuclease subunit S n=1 Tax=Novosphingobium aureum TaxID=2792964 RepID=A0A931HD99_9SPHN|nr:restriction endonuclease subunit S [Novosphingobium aureum]MBH0113672.1 restriction endonuclease subunit S [Novosphingobium aureum]
MNGLPQGWATISLAEAVEPDAPIIYGILQPGPDQKEGVPYVRPTEIVNDAIQLTELRRTTPEIAKRYSRSSLDAGDVLLSIVGTIGKVATVPEDLAGGNITQSSCRVRARRALTSTAFMAHFLRSPSARRQFDEARLGTAVPRLNLEDVRAMELPVSPLPEQRRIVAKIDSLTGKSKRARDHLDHIPRLVEKYKQAILAAAFRGDLTRGMEHNGIAAQGGDRIDARASQLDELPIGWAWASIGGVGQVTGGLTKNAARKSLPKQVPYLRVANVYANQLRLADIAHVGCTEAEYQRTLLRAGDLLVVEGNGSIDQIGRVAVWNDEVPGCSHQNHLIRVSLDRAVLPEFALYWLMSPGGRAAIEAVASSSSGLHTLSISKVKGLPIPICSEAEQTELVRRIKSAFAWVERLSSDASSSRKLIDRLDQSVLAKAFKGELVPQDPADEPASALLDRIRSERATAPKAKRGRKKAA